MSIKKLFEKSAYKVLENKNLDEIGTEVESAGYIKQYREQKNRFVPHVDFATASNFAFYGSAEQYYEDAFNRVIDSYPYDGSLREKLIWHNSSSYIDEYIFDRRYPRTNGYIKLGTQAYSTVEASGLSTAYKLPSDSDLEYVLMKGGPHVDNIWITGSLRETNLKLDATNGNTVEFWLKKKAFDTSGNYGANETIFDIYSTGSDSTSAGYNRLTIGLNGTASATPFRITYMSGSGASAGGFGYKTIGASLTPAIVADDKWHHYAFTFQNSGSAQQASTTITFTGQPTADQTIVIVDAVGTSKTYTAKGSSDFGDREFGIGSEVSPNTVSAIAAELKSCIEHANGHNGTITVSRSDGVLTLTQATAGANGNTTITENLDNCAVVGADGSTSDKFTGGTDVVKVRLYVDGDLNDTVVGGTNKISSSAGSTALVATVGALAYPPSGTTSGLAFSVGDANKKPGWAKLSGSLDEFRFWKIKRTSKQIGRYWFTQVAGGGNTDKEISASLGVYYKFNEGITGVTATDEVVLDYSGRVSNGAWTGYVAAGRTTGSAMIEVSASATEFKDPIIRSNHPSVKNLKADLKSTGSIHDVNNSSMIYNTIPSWIVEETEETENRTLKKLIQIVGSYFDTLQLQIQAIPGIKHNTYFSSSFKPMPFARSLIENQGMFAPEIFVDSEVIEQLASRDEDREYKEKIYDVKNLIYHNIYNNLVHIYKTKGTEKSFRNLIRCFGVDDELIKINMYAENAIYDLDDKYRETTVKKKYIDFNHGARIDGTVYQATSSANSSVSFLSGSPSLQNFPITTQADIIFPKRIKIADDRFYSSTFVSSSLFGVHATEREQASATVTFTGQPTADQTIVVIDAVGTSKTYTAKGSSDFGDREFGIGSPPGSGGSANTVSAIAAELKSCIEHANGHNGTITVSRSDGILTLTQATAGPDGNTTITENLDNCTVVGADGSTSNKFTGGSDAAMKWANTDVANFQVFAAKDENTDDADRVRFILSSSISGFPKMSTDLYYNVYDNQRWNLAVRISCPYSPAISGSNDYKVEFCGVNAVTDTIYNEFFITGALAAPAGEDFAKTHKRFYIGAHRQNFTGSTIYQYCDTKISSFRVWLSRLEDEAIRGHARDAASYGPIYPYRNAYLFESPASASMGSSHTYVPKIDTLLLHWDFSNVTSSNSDGRFLVNDISSGSVGTKSRYKLLENIYGVQHTGKGDFFPTSSTQVVQREYIPSARIKPIESVDNIDMITTLNRGDQKIYTRNRKPLFHFLAFEKSMYQTISEEMLKMFGSIKAFNNLIGEPVNRYRMDYKNMAKLRQLFFEKTENTIDLDKYVEFYKWIDAALSVMLEQLIPASVNSSEGIRNMVESHALERNKYWTKFPTLEMKQSDPEASLFGIQEMLYDWEHGHRPLDDDQEDNCLWWKERASRKSDAIKSNAAAPHNANREKIKDAMHQHHSRSAAVLTKTDGTPYTGSIYRLRKFSKIYNLEGLDSLYLHGGTNQHRHKRAEYVMRATDNTNNALYVSASKINYPAKCDDVINPNKKVEYGLRVHDKTKALDTGGNIAAPFSLYSSSVTTGYNKILADNFTASVDLANLHFDGLSGEEPLQGPFTAKWVGGRQHRNIRLNFSSSGPNTLLNYNGLDHAKKRPEAWKINFVSADKVLYFVHPGVGYPQARYFRDETAKRPLNIKNIRTVTASATSSVILGNYKNTYEIVQTSGRKINNFALRVSGGFTETKTNSTFISGVIDYALNIRKTQKVVFTERFAAPGGPDVSSEGVLDKTAGEYASHNALPFRNLSVRLPLRALLSEHCAQFGSSTTATATITFTDRPAFGLAAATATVTFTGQPTADQTIIIIDQAGLSKTYTAKGSSDFGDREFGIGSEVSPNTVSAIAAELKSCIEHANGHNGTITVSQSSGELTLTQSVGGTDGNTVITETLDNCTVLGGDGSTSNKFTGGTDETIKIISADGTSITYTARGSSDFGENEFSQGDAGTTAAAEQLKLCIQHAKGHGGKITGSITGGVLTLTQQIAGTDGNTTITEVLSNTTTTNFTGGTGGSHVHRGPAAAYHKINRNAGRRYKMDGDEGSSPTFEIVKKYDNWYVQHQIPQSDLGYAWISASYISTKQLGFHTGSDGITFVSASQIGSYLTSDRFLGPDQNDGKTGFLFTDFVDMNHHVYTAITSSLSGLSMNTYGTTTIEGHTDASTSWTYRGGLKGPPGGGSDPLKLSNEYNGSVKILNTLLLNRNGPYQHPTWKQIRTGDHPIARYHKRNNVISIIKPGLRIARIK